ncbi:MAG: hypothetical protein ACI4DY_03140, partial [Monoglobaceae bacterium]
FRERSVPSTPLRLLRNRLSLAPWRQLCENFCGLLGNVPFHRRRCDFCEIDYLLPRGGSFAKISADC